MGGWLAIPKGMAGYLVHSRNPRSTLFLVYAENRGGVGDAVAVDGGPADGEAVGAAGAGGVAGAGGGGSGGRTARLGRGLGLAGLALATASDSVGGGSAATGAAGSGGGGAVGTGADTDGGVDCGGLTRLTAMVVGRSSGGVRNA